MLNDSCDVTIIMPPMWHVREPWTAPAYICEALRARQYRVQFLDYNIELYRQCDALGYGYLWHDGAFFNPWINGQLDYFVQLFDLTEIRADVVGISVVQTSCSVSIALARRIRREFPDKKIVFGGHPYFFQKELARIPPDCVDAVCKGEGEHTIVELMEKGFARIGEIAGLYLPGENGWQLTAERPVEKNLDVFPWPRFEGIDLNRYGKHFLPIMGARGCIGRCIFCSDRYRTPGYRTRSAMHQVDELEYLTQTFNVEHFPYNDPLMNGNVKVLQEKAEEILRRGVKAQYGGNMMVRADMPEDLFFTLRKSGMSVALIGVESGCVTTLQHMRKRHTPEMAGHFVRCCHNAGIKTELNFILGFPTETEEHFQETCEFIRTNKDSISAVISIVPLQVQPSDLFDQREAFDIVLEDTNDYGSWWLKDGSNTPEVRWRRIEQFRKLVGDLGLLEDHVIDGRIGPASGYAPTPVEFLRRLKEWRKGNPHLAMGAPLAGVETEKRLKANIERQPVLALPVMLTRKTVQSLREDGLRDTLRRGREWLTIQYRTRTGR